MKQYLLFAGKDYFPEGGCSDFVGAFDSIDEAVKAHDPHLYEYSGGWANIFFVKECKKVGQFNRGVWDFKVNQLNNK